MSMTICARNAWSCPLPRQCRKASTGFWSIANFARTKPLWRPSARGSCAWRVGGGTVRAFAIAMMRCNVRTHHEVPMPDIRFVDTTIRDGHQSLWAERMSTGMMMPIAKNLDEAGFEAIELLSGSHIKKAVRELREDPWERIKRLCALFPDPPIRLIAGRVNTFAFDPPCMYELFIGRMAANGIRQARISEPWNDLPGWPYRVKGARPCGVDPIVNLIYSVSPVHTDEYYAERCRQAVTLKPFRLCLKDPGGLLTPERIRTLVPIVLKNAGGIPVELHSHCTTGLGPLVALEAVRLGIRIVNTGVPPLADGSALPSIFNVAHNLRALGYKPILKEEELAHVCDHV